MEDCNIISNEYLIKFLTQREISFEKYSNFYILLSDARIITGRNPISGIKGNHLFYNEEKQIFLDPNSIIGLISYLIILDLIGNVFVKKSITTQKTNSIYKALRFFSNLNDFERNAIIGLRNSLVHDFSLLNRAKNNKSQNHKYSISFNIEDELLILPSLYWDGKNETLNLSEYTTISYHKLIDEIENVIQNLIDDIKNELVNVDITKIEFEYKYTCSF